MKRKIDQPGKFKCDQPECGRTFDYAKALGSHKLRAHGIHGQARSSILAREKRAAESKGLKPKHHTLKLEKLPCPHCEFVANWKGGLKLHMNKKHPGQDPNPTPKPGKEKSLVKRTAKAIVLNGHAHENGQDHSNANGTHPDALVAIASGRFTEICSGMAFEFDLPVRSFTARVAAFIYATQVR